MNIKEFVIVILLIVGMITIFWIMYKIKNSPESDDNSIGRDDEDQYYGSGSYSR